MLFVLCRPVEFEATIYHNLMIMCRWAGTKIILLLMSLGDCPIASEAATRCSSLRCNLVEFNPWLLLSVSVVQVLILASLVCLFTASFSLTLLSLSIGLAERVQQAAEQLRGVRMQDTLYKLCFCCSSRHRHPETDKTIPCDRQLVYLKLKEWYGNHKDKGEEKGEEKLSRLIRGSRRT